MHIRGKNRVDRMRRKVLAFLLLGITSVPFVFGAMAARPQISYVSQTAITVTADYFGLPANSQLVLVNSSTGTTTTSLAAVSGTSTVSTTTVPSGSSY